MVALVVSVIASIFWGKYLPTFFMRWIHHYQGSRCLKFIAAHSFKEEQLKILLGGLLIELTVV